MVECSSSAGPVSGRETTSETEKLLQLIHDFGFFENEHELVSVVYIGSALGYDIPISKESIFVRIGGLSEPSTLMNLVLLEKAGFIENTHKTGTIRLRDEGRTFLERRSIGARYDELYRRLKSLDRNFWPMLSMLLLDRANGSLSVENAATAAKRTFGVDNAHLGMILGFVKQT